MATYISRDIRRYEYCWAG